MGRVIGFVFELCCVYVMMVAVFFKGSVFSAPAFNNSQMMSNKSYSNQIALPNRMNPIIVSPGDLKRPDHLEGVKLERDGHLNSEFRKEVFIGTNNKLLVEEEKSPEKILTEVFHKADSNHDKELILDELSQWISMKVKEHLNEAVKENFFLFTAIDRDHNGLVTWKEFHYNFMVNQGFGIEYAKEHIENHKELERKVREQILLDQAAFFEAARTNPEGLNIDEFLSFRHPEHSHVTLLNMVQEIFNNLDDDGDNYLTVDEFASFAAAPVADEIKGTDELWQQERKREFQEAIDTNHDGKVTRQELLLYSDPQNPAHSKTEARNLISLADLNQDQKLTLDEVLAKKDVFLGSKMVNTAQSFHDEF